MFLSHTGKWTAKPERARDFGTSLTAIDVIQQFDAEQAQIILKFDDPRYDIVLHMKPSQNPPQRDRRV